MLENNVMRARWTAIVFGALASLTLIAFVYAFVQRAEAQRQAALLIECERNSAELVKELEVINREAIKEVERAEEALKQSEEMRLKAESTKK